MRASPLPLALSLSISTATILNARVLTRISSGSNGRQLALPFFLSCYCTVLVSVMLDIRVRECGEDRPVRAVRWLKGEAQFGIVTRLCHPGLVSTQSLTGPWLRPWARFHPFHHHRASSSTAGFIAPAAHPSPLRGLFLSPTLCICSYLCFRKRRASIVVLSSKCLHQL